MQVISNRKKRQSNPIPINAPVSYQKLVYILALDKIFKENNITQIE